MRAIRHRLRPLGCDEHGVAAVEFALVAPVFFALVLSIVDIGRYMWTLNTIQYAIDDAVRAGVVQHMDAEDVETRAKDSLAHLGTTTGTIDVTATPSASTLEVTATTTYSFLFPISSFLENTTIDLRTEMPQ